MYWEMTVYNWEKILKAFTSMGYEYEEFEDEVKDYSVTDFIQAFGYLMGYLPANIKHKIFTYMLESEIREAISQ